MTVIGLTGGIASGKSTVARILAERDVRLIDADLVARELMGPGQPAFKAVVKRFGSEIIDADGTIDRMRLGQIVFGNAGELEVLDSLVHPLVVQEIGQQAAFASEDFVVIEAIKLFESGLDEICDAVWVVTCDSERQIARLVETRGLSRAQAVMRVEAQGDPAIRAAQADQVIVNDGSLEDLECAVAVLYAALQVEQRNPSGSKSRHGGLFAAGALSTVGAGMVLALAPEAMGLAQRVFAVLLLGVMAVAASAVVAIEYEGV